MASYTEWDKLVALFRTGSPKIAKAFDEAKKHSVRQDAELTALAALINAPTPVPPPPSGAMNRTTMTWPGATILRQDNGEIANPEPGMWGNIEAVSDARHVHKTTGGCPYPKGDGVAQGNTAYRELTVVDGDDFFGERVQLGRNDWDDGENTGSQTLGTFALAFEGQRKLTFWSMRFPTSYPMNVVDFQQILQWKQAQPYNNSLIATRNIDGNGVSTEVQLWNNLLQLHTWWNSRWNTAAPVKNQWIRFALDTTFSQWNETGKIQLFADTDGDGDWLDADEMSPVVNGATMSYATSAHSGLAAGDSVPCYLSLGTYHEVSVYGTTVVDVDNVQVCSVP